MQVRASNREVGRIQSFYLFEPYICCIAKCCSSADCFALSIMQPTAFLLLAKNYAPLLNCHYFGIVFEMLPVQEWLR